MLALLYDIYTRWFLQWIFIKKKKKTHTHHTKGHVGNFFFFFEREFQLMASVPDNSFLLSDQDTNQFWCKQGLNPKFLIQPSETLLVELTGTHNISETWAYYALHMKKTTFVLMIGGKT